MFKKFLLFLYMEKNLQHVQVPNEMATNDLLPKDQLVYAVIHSHDNPEHECFPSLVCIAKECGASINTVRDSIKRLKEAGYITTELKGRQTYYYFSEYKKFEPFSPEFIKRDDLTFLTKSYIVATQQHMYKDVKNYGKLSISNRALAKEINMPESAIRKCNKELERQHFLTILKDNMPDPETGCKGEVKVFQLDALGQAVIWGLCDHEERIRETEAKTDYNAQRLTELENTVKSQSRLINQLLKTVQKDIPEQQTEYAM